MIYFQITSTMELWI